ncbi:MAG: hypothetical protein K8L97_31210 [Anaerolineae bacterium]|nr:hypothetical protein [Anaerolineae bacterium]
MIKPQDQYDNANILMRWYHQASELPGSINSYLAVLRSHENTTEQQQQEVFGVSADEFLRLKAMRLPRKHMFVEDAYRIAVFCKLEHPQRFVSSMLLARNLMSHGHQTATLDQFYEAAFDERDDLDELPEE